MIDLTTSWVPVPLRWRHVETADVIVAPDGELWQVTDTWFGRACKTATAARGRATFSRDVDPDDVIPVLIPVTERDAVELTIEQLGARLVERRTTAPPQT